MGTSVVAVCVFISLILGSIKFVTGGTFVGFVHCVDTLVVSEIGLPAGVLIENGVILENK